MRIFVGAGDLSAFRLQAIEKKLQAFLPSVQILETQSVYFVDSETSLDAKAVQRLEQLLQAKQADNFTFVETTCNLMETTSNPNETPCNSRETTSNPNETTCKSTETAQKPLIIIPRLGTISPWSSKATDIIHHCGLNTVKRVEKGWVFYFKPEACTHLSQHPEALQILHDRMTQTVCTEWQATEAIFAEHQPALLKECDIKTQGIRALQEMNQKLALALSDEEIQYLYQTFQQLDRNPTDAELMMFAQANSEHCRHKIFNARWTVDGEQQPHSLFQMIRFTHQRTPDHTLSAYSDNGAIVEGVSAQRWLVDFTTKQYQSVHEPIHTVIKVETHNHPTAIAPFPGAATGAGGEIRDGGSTGRGGKPRAGLTGFSVSNLRIPGFIQPWEKTSGKPEHIASALEIMLAGPIGGASFNNEFGRASLLGYFRTYEQQVTDHTGVAWRGYHKPIMIAGGVSHVRDTHVHKESLPVAALVIVLGGPAMEIGLGGGAASSMTAGSSNVQLDFASVQRSNPEMERRCQEVIDACISLGKDNPILSIHDVGAGGLANAVPELLEQSDRGGELQLRAILCHERGMSPLAIWCNESQERYVIAIDPKHAQMFRELCERERCPYAIIGEAVEKQHIRLHDSLFDNWTVNLPNHVLFGKLPPLQRNAKHQPLVLPQWDYSTIDLKEAAERLLRLPTIASKNFLITIGDRTISGLVTRDQMVGPWQVPVSDVAVIAKDYQGYYGDAMAMGERAPVALIDAAASCRMAIAEAITNIAAAKIEDLKHIKLSANWMAAANYPGEDTRLFDGVKAVAMEFCPQLELSIPVGKDSLFMNMKWDDQQIAAPLSLIVTAFGQVSDVRKTLTPMLRTDQGETTLIFVDLAAGKQRLGGSCLAQVFSQLGHEAPDVNQPQLLKAFFNLIQQLNQENKLLAYHDRSDGGLFVTLCEMAFPGHVGIDVNLDSLGHDVIASLFNEELGAVIQVRNKDADNICQQFKAQHLSAYAIAQLNHSDEINFYHHKQKVLSNTRAHWYTMWNEVSFHMQKLRDNPVCADQAFAQIQDVQDKGLFAELSFDLNVSLVTPYINVGAKPQVAIVREQGVNGQSEMAAAFDRAAFTVVDVHMQDLISGHTILDNFVGLVMCGGFSYGDVLGAGRGWASTILHHEKLYQQFKTFFARKDRFALGVCNGCQMMSQLQEIIPGSEDWPVFNRNVSEQFEARLVMAEIPQNRSLFFKDMAGSRMPIAVAHGEGLARWQNRDQMQRLLDQQLVALRYVDNSGQITEQYPYNPNGSPLGITGISNQDGRILIMMPHPERVFRAVQFSWRPDEWQERSPWLRMFENARAWLEKGERS